MVEHPMDTFTSAPSSHLIVWRFVDGKAGHEAQSQGLIEALGRQVSVHCECFDVRGLPQGFPAWVMGRFPAGDSRPEPNLIVGAGHRTHLPMLTARRAWGGTVAVLMRPSLPSWLFDYVIMPEHDGRLSRKNVFVTKGVLNTVRPAESAVVEQGLILIGGPSRHHGWDDRTLADQVRLAVAGDAGVHWTVTTSRRTPDSTVALLQGLGLKNCTIVPVSETEPGWVANQLKRCGRVMVSEDSASMVFEALTAGARVGLLAVPSHGRKSRVEAAMQGLRDEGRVFGVGETPGPDRPCVPLAEADRAAEWLLSRLSFK